MFQIINGGTHTRHPAGFLMNRIRGFKYHVLIITRTEAQLIIRDKVYSIAPGTAFFIEKGTPYSYKNPKGSYADDWLHFDYTETDSFNRGLFATPFSLSSPQLAASYIQSLLYEHNYSDPSFKDEHSHFLFKILLDHLEKDFFHPASSATEVHRYEMQKFRIALKASPKEAGSASQSAARFGLSLSRFQHLYTQYFGLSYQQDIIQMKIDYAKELLSSTNMKVEDISEECGYENTVHFFRQFQKVTMMTPGQFRKIEKKSPPGFDT